MSKIGRSKKTTPLEALFCAFAVLGCVLIASATGRVFGIIDGRNEVTAREHYEREKQNALKDCLDGKAGVLADCVTKAIEAAQHNSESRQDLFAQRDAARWAFWSMVSGWATLGITAVGVWLLKRTLDATLEAVEETAEATDEMRKSNAIAEETAQRQLRAYLYPAAGELTLVPQGATATCPIRIPFRNTGSTPATLMYYKIKSSIRSNYAMIAHMHSHRSQEIRLVETNIQKIIGPNNETYISIDGQVDLKHFSKTSTAAAGYEFDGVEFEITLEWHYRDYLNRLWRVDAVFTTDAFSWDSRSGRYVKAMRQKSAKERQIR